MTIVQLILTTTSRIAWLFAGSALGIVSVAATTDIQQRLDTKAKTCLDLQRLVAQYESKAAAIMKSHRNLQCLYERERRIAGKYTRVFALLKREFVENDDNTFASIDDLDINPVY
ncbi:hypothetical protein IW147_002058 [Coemansia sp. RSA 720]|nr:hypothetical protein IW147_002058 [Coemansia sp. RSA 720]